MALLPRITGFVRLKASTTSTVLGEAGDATKLYSDKHKWRLAHCSQKCSPRSTENAPHSCHHRPSNQSCPVLHASSPSCAEKSSLSRGRVCDDKAPPDPCPKLKRCSLDHHLSSFKSARVKTRPWNTVAHCGQHHTTGLTSTCISKTSIHKNPLTTPLLSAWFVIASGAEASAKTTTRTENISIWHPKMLNSPPRCKMATCAVAAVVHSR